MNEIDKLGGTIAMGDGKSAAPWNKPEIIGVSDPKLPLVGEEDREWLKGRLLFRAFDLFGGHSVTGRYLFSRQLSSVTPASIVAVLGP